MPELGKTRRIAAAEGGGRFVGTDISYDDISSANRETEKDTHKILRQEKLAGADCYVIESTPRDSSYQYSKMILWIDKGSYVNYRLELYDKKGKLTKIFETLELRNVDGRLSPWVTKMTTTGSGTFTTIYVQKLQYDANIPEAVFTTNYLETGRAQ